MHPGVSYTAEEDQGQRAQLLGHEAPATVHLILRSSPAQVGQTLTNQTPLCESASVVVSLVTTLYPQTPCKFCKHNDRAGGRGSVWERQLFHRLWSKATVAIV